MCCRPRSAHAARCCNTTNSHWFPYTGVLVGATASHLPLTVPLMSAIKAGHVRDTSVMLVRASPLPPAAAVGRRGARGRRSCGVATLPVSDSKPPSSPPLPLMSQRKCRSIPRPATTVTISFSPCHPPHDYSPTLPLTSKSEGHAARLKATQHVPALKALLAPLCLRL